MRSPLVRAAAGALAVAVALLVGCPPPAPPTPPGGGGGPGPTTGAPGPGAGTDGTPPGPGAGTDGAGPAGAPAPWALIPEGRLERVYPTLQPARTWPAPAALRAPKDLPEAQRPKPEAVALLVDLVEKVVRPELRPKDPEAAVGVDDRGRTFLRLGRDKAVGSASLDVKGVPEDKRFDFPVVALALDDPAPGAQTLERLDKRVKAVVAPMIADELAREVDGKRPFALELSPQARDADGVAALAILDPSGVGTQFQYLYAWGTETHVLVVLQMVPHMRLEPR